MPDKYLALCLTSSQLSASSLPSPFSFLPFQDRGQFLGSDSVASRAWSWSVVLPGRCVPLRPISLR
jgi:hypothetical protein